MIELNKKTQQDFLNREWVQRLLDAGVDMSDAKYHLLFNSILDGHKDKCYVVTNLPNTYEEYKEQSEFRDILPTYTVSELLYKLHEYIYPTIDGKEYSGGLKFCKDAPFYIWYYGLSRREEYEGDTNLKKEDYIYAEAEYPIESLVMILIQCHQKDVGIKYKDTGNISNK